MQFDRNLLTFHSSVLPSSSTMRIEAAGFSKTLENFCQAPWHQTIYSFIIIDEGLKSLKAYCSLLEPDMGAQAN